MRTMLRKYRTAQGFSQASLGEAVGGVDHSTVSLWESGRSRPTFDNAVALERVLGVPATRLFEPAPNASER